MIGCDLAQFRITDKIGEGGMGTVYRGEDTRLGRAVAIKVLPPELVQDAERAARFEREGRVLANLNHPNIAQIYDVGRAAPEGKSAPASDGGAPAPVHFLAMELVEGPTLAERLAAGALPREEALEIARQIAEGLEAAHEKGIVHRDLKPANIKLAPDGRVKILDFGLAKALEPVESGSDSVPQLAHSPTLTFHPTLQGVILGTAAYMSPEQAKGLPADKRADVWAFGVVLFEMLTGARLFEGETATETLARVLMAEIDLGALSADTPAGLRRLLRRCLERNPRNRIHDVADARILLEEVRAGGGSSAEAAAAAEPAAGPATPPRRRALVVAALLAGGAALGWLGHFALTAGVAKPGSEGSGAPLFRQLTRLPGGEWDPSLSPDGEQFLFVKEDGGDLDIFSQRVDGHRAINLTEGCADDDTWPAFSPDGRLVAFESECGGGGIFVMGATGESVRRVSDFGSQPAWSPDGTELAVVSEPAGAPTSRVSESELWVVRVADGTRRRVTEQDAMAPSWSPDGRRIAIWGLWGESVQRDLWTVAADGSAPAEADALRLLDDPAIDWAPVWSADGGWIYFVSSRGGTFNLWRMAVEPSSGAPRGAPEAITAPSSWIGRFGLSRDRRHLVYTDVNTQGVLLRAPLDLAAGKLAGEPATAFQGSMTVRDQTLSPDGSQVVISNEEQPQQLHIIGGDGSGYRQLTTGTDRNRQGDWSPDAEWIAFQSNRDPNAVWLVRPDGSGMRSISVGELSVSVPFWSPDGKTIASFDTGKGGFLLDLSAGFDAPEVVALPEPAPGQLFWPVSWSADGALLVGRIQSAGGAPGGALVYSLESGTYRELSLPREANLLQVFFADAHRLVFLAGNRILLGDVRGGPPKVLYEGRPPHSVGELSVSADGRWLAWIESTDESDIWLMENQ